MNENIKKVIELADGECTSVEIAELVGLSPRYIRRILQNNNLPRLGCGARKGADNHMFVCGRRVDHDGYVLITPPESHPYARSRPNRNAKVMFEHRFVMEQKLGRFLLPTEIVDHIDGLTLHNAPENLRLFSSNAEHLKATIAGKKPNWSKAGYQNIGTRSDLGQDYQPVGTYHQNKAKGDVRLRQILLAWLSLDKDSPYLLGTHRHLEKAQIDYSSRSSLKRALDGLYRKYA